MFILVEGRPRQDHLAAIDLRTEFHLGTVVGRQRRQADRDGLFAGSDAGGERAVIAYTIPACCRFADVNPVEYLRDVLPRLARRVRLRDLPDLLPSRWKAAREAAAAAAASPAPAASEPAPAVAG